MSNKNKYDGLKVERVYTSDALKDLVRENAELKEQNRSYEQLLETGSVTLMKERLKNYKQLTKAKEIIKQLLDSCFGYNSKTVNYEVKVKAEQFLKEIEI